MEGVEVQEADDENDDAFERYSGVILNSSISLHVLFLVSSAVTHAYVNIIVL